MTHRFSLRSIERCRRVDPRLVAVAVVALARSPIDFGITEEQSRTFEDQQKKVAAGVSTTMNSKHIIPAGGVFSRAIDLVPWIDGKSQWGDENWMVKRNDGSTVDPFCVIAAMMRSAAVDTGIRIRWGGVWDRTLNDLPPGGEAMRKEVDAYVARRKAANPGARVFIDGPHFELLD